ncbi:MAG: sulfatase-like hydrolase/transferase [Planctomycetota bacterium]|jgi:N-acetylgalactosamine-6-sulfatase
MAMRPLTLLLALSLISEAHAFIIITVETPHDDPSVRSAVAKRPEIVKSRRSLQRLEQLAVTRRLKTTGEPSSSPKIAILSKVELEERFGKPAEWKPSDYARPCAGDRFMSFSAASRGPIPKGEPLVRTEFYTLKDVGGIFVIVFHDNAVISPAVVYLRVDDKFPALKQVENLPERLDWERPKLEKIRKWLGVRADELEVTEEELQRGAEEAKKLRERIEEFRRLRGRSWSSPGDERVGLSAPASTTPRPERPNIVFLLADDLGYGDLGCYGAEDVQTPRLDRLAEEGVLLTDCYANASICSPTRAALMTGRYQQRIGLEWAVYYQVRGEGLPPEEKSIAEMIRERGYATAMVGKWHLGYDPEWAPNHHGFDRFFGLLGGNHHYFEHYDRKGVHDLYVDTKPVRREGYSTDLFGRRAADLIESMKDRPFFLYVAFNAPHFPFQGPNDADRLVTPKQGWQTGNRATYAAMIESLDANVGRIVDALDEHGLRERTLVVFTSDNGGMLPLSRNAPLAKGKGTLWEGGIRVPGIACWPGQIPARTRSEQVVLTMDWAATFVKLAGGRPPRDRPFDGIDLTAMLTMPHPPLPRTVFWRRSPDPYRKNVVPHRAVRWETWKYLDQPSGERYLFDLSQDAAERRNLVEAEPHLAERLRKLLDAWEADVDPPIHDQRPSRSAAGRK